MPNWCNNSITISGPTAKIKALWDEANTKPEEGEAGLLHAMVPMPSVGDDWYSWRVNSWGTKWEIDPEELEYEDNEDGTSTIAGWFESAWSPPTTAYDTFTANNQDCTVEATYYECGVCFVGKYSSVEGTDDCYSIDFDDEDWAGNIPSELIDDYGLDNEYENYKEWQEDEKETA
jgi:hypothetical protein